MNGLERDHCGGNEADDGANVGTAALSVANLLIRDPHGRTVTRQAMVPDDPGKI